MVEWDFLCPRVKECHSLVTQHQFDYYCSKPWGCESPRCPFNSKFAEKVLPTAWLKKYTEKYQSSASTAKEEAS